MLNSRLISRIILLLLVMAAVLQCACQPKTAVNPDYDSCLMLMDGLYVLAARDTGDELPDDTVSGGEVTSFWGSMPRENGETSSADIVKGSAICHEAGKPSTVWVHDAESGVYFKFLRCDICVAADGMLYADDPRGKQISVRELPDGYALLGETVCPEAGGLPRNGLEAIGLPEGTALYMREDQADHIYVEIAKNEEVLYKRLARLISLA